MRYSRLTREELEELVQKIEARIEFLRTDRTKWHSVWAMPDGHSHWDHGPYFRRLETRKLKARLKTIRARLSRITP